MTLNNTSLKKLEGDFPFSLSPEQRSILLSWFGTDSKFGWTRLDFMLGAHRVCRLYPDHRHKLYKDMDGLLTEPNIDFSFDFDIHRNPVIHFYDDDDVPF
jgi:hypothetical protein